MARPLFYRLLEIPGAYHLAQWLLAPGADRSLERHYDVIYRDVRGRVLDLGCGPAPLTRLPSGTLLGMDVNPEYVKTYRTAPAGSDCRLQGVVGSADRIPFRTGAFDECRTASTLHHLPDDMVTRTVGEMARIVRPGGRVVILDMVWPRTFLSGPVAWMICRFDRGEFVRTAEELARLARRACNGEWSVSRVSYSWWRIQAVFLILTKA